MAIFLREAKNSRPYTSGLCKTKFGSTYLRENAINPYEEVKEKLLENNISQFYLKKCKNQPQNALFMTPSECLQISAFTHSDWLRA